MNNLKIKVCGLTEPANIQAVRDLGVDLLGFIFHPPSPRYVVGKAAPGDIAALGTRQEKVGVFVNETVDNMTDIATAYGLGTLQLHGQEPPHICLSLRAHFNIIKVFPIADVHDFEPTKDYEGTCDYFLFDTKGPSHGGNGFAFDWRILDTYSGNTPFLLSGGISPKDADKVRQINHPKMAGVDLNSRFELSPGVKDVVALFEFDNLINLIM